MLISIFDEPHALAAQQLLAADKVRRVEFNEVIRCGGPFMSPEGVLVHFGILLEGTKLQVNRLRRELDDLAKGIQW